MADQPTDPHADPHLPDLRFLTELEKGVIEMAGHLWNHICAAVPEGPAREADLAELAPAIHLIQRYFMGQAAVRAYPGEYRGLGVKIGGDS